MNSEERLLRAVRHEPGDMVPVSPRIHHFLEGYYGCSCWLHQLKAAGEFDYDPTIMVGPFLPNCIWDPYGLLEPVYIAGYTFKLENASRYKGPRGNVQVKLDVMKEENHIIVDRQIATPEGPLTDKTKIQMPTAEYYTPDPTKTEYLLKDPEDLEKIKYLLPDPSRANIADFVEIQKSVGNRGLVTVVTDSPIDNKYVYDMKHMMIDYYRNKTFLLKLLRLFQEHLLAETKTYLDAGAKAIFCAWYHASLSVGWSPKAFGELFVPLIREHVKLVHDYDAVYDYYDDGKCMLILGMLKECAVDIVETLTPPPLGDVDLARAKKEVGDKLTLKGHIDHWHTIKTGTPDTIESAVKKAIEIAAPGGGFILGTSDSIRPGTSMENVRAYFHAARKYGVY